MENSYLNFRKNSSIKNVLFIQAFLILLTVHAGLTAQSKIQNIRGKILDKDSQLPLIGVNIVIKNSNPLKGTISDINGAFELNEVPTGRHQLECSYTGYETFLTDHFIINSARVEELTINLVESAVSMQEVVVQAQKFGNEALNELSILSTRSFSVDETQRYAASANDPGRMAMGFPGVQPSRDSRSDIIVRGNSGIGLLWRLEGIDIPNPNHFARRGSSGGGLTIFSVSMLGNSDFSTGAFPAEYGNAVSGVFDIKFRKGNKEKLQQSFRAGMLGLDYSAEGPFQKGKQATFLFNYRYSTLGLLNKLGLHLVGARVDNVFQDISFNLHFPSTNNKRIFTIWGIGGLSQENERAEEKMEDWKSFSDYLTRDVQSDMGTLGMTYFTTAGKNAFLKTNLAFTHQTILFSNDTLNALRNAFTNNAEAYKESRIVLNSSWNKKFNTKWTLKTGIILSQIHYNLFRNTLSDSIDINAQGNTQLLQAFIQLRFRPFDRLTINLGTHATHFNLNKKSAIEPRIGVKYQLSEKHALMAAVGLHSKVLPLGNHFTLIKGREVNREIGFLKTQHYVLGYDFFVSETWKIHAELYFQTLKDVPVSVDSGSSWSILNTIDGFVKDELVNVGTGENSGLDISLEKSFDKGLFMILSTSIFQSKYTDASGRRFPTIFDSGLSGALMCGKEWMFKNASVLQIGLKSIYNGGQRLTPLLDNVETSRFDQHPALDDSRAFSEQVADYFRTDFRISFRKNNRHTAWTIGLDIQNALNKRNIDAINRTYDPDINDWIYRKQSGLTPVLSFQIDW